MAERSASDYRRYGATSHPGVSDFYREHHAWQTLSFVLECKERFLPLRRERMSVWRAIAQLEEIVDGSDPDFADSQRAHALQTAEALRADDQPRWLILTGFVHDLGKLLCRFGEPQWAVVGDTYAVGCRFPDVAVHREYLEANPDASNPAYASATGIYQPGCGLDRVHFSWGHDEYLYQVMRPYLRGEALAILRYHSCYSWHSGGAYRELMDDCDHAALPWVQRFSPYDLYSKREALPDWERQRSYYRELVAEFLPESLDW